MKKILKIIAVILLLLILATGIGFYIYVSDPYQPHQTAVENLVPSDSVKLTVDSKKEIVFEPEEIKAGFIFYPGGLVEYESYAPLLHRLADQGILCVMEHMPCDLAVLNMDAAEGIQERWPEVETWYIGGHSLGGAMASSYLGSCQEDYEGLILLAAFSASDLSEKDIRVLSLYGSEDQVMNRDSYDKYRPNLPSDLTEIEIPGGCHAWFGSYGKQKGDGEASITPEEQWDFTVEVIISWMGFIYTTNR